MQFIRFLAVVCSWLAVTPAVPAAQPEPSSGTLYLKSAADGPAIEALKVSTSIHATVTGTVARVRVTQRFTNSGDAWVEGLYVFPLSADAAVDQLTMTVGERRIRGDVQERSQARATYTQARDQGRSASIVDQERPNLFTSAVANIAPHAAVEIEIAYLETIAYRDARYTLRLPLAITPRYTPGAPLDPGAPLAAVRAAARNALAGTTATPERVTAAAQAVDVGIDLAAGFPLATLSSLHHPVVVQDQPTGKHIQLSGSQIAGDHDFELVWTPAAVGLTGAAFTEAEGADTYALLLLTPPAASDAAPPPRAVTFIIDTSGSMEGPSIEQARAALELGIDRLGSLDEFNVIRFASDSSSLFDAPRIADLQHRSLAQRFIAGLQASGGTEMRAPLEQALADPPDPGYLRQIVFITDGSVGNETELVSLIQARIGAARLFTVGIGAAPNAYFLETAAAAGRGSYTFIAAREQVAARMADLFRKLESPALVDLEVSWPSGMQAELASAVPADVYAGDPLVLLARLPQAAADGGSPAGAVRVSGRIGGAPWSQTVGMTAAQGDAGLAKLWARERIAGWGRELHAAGGRDDLRASIIALALQHHLVSEFTSLVAVDEMPVRPPGSAGQVEQAPTSAPAGSYWATTGFARTATSAPLLWLWGLVLITGAGGARWLLRRKGAA